MRLTERLVAHSVFVHVKGEPGHFGLCNESSCVSGICREDDNFGNRKQDRCYKPNAREISETSVEKHTGRGHVQIMQIEKRGPVRCVFIQQVTSDESLRHNWEHIWTNLMEEISGNDKHFLFHF